MILVDTALQRRAAEGRPIRVGVFGAGFMARGFVAHVSRSVPGMTVSAICNRHVERARACFALADVTDVVDVADAAGLDDAIGRDRHVVTDDPTTLTRSARLDCLIDITGDVEYGARVALDAIEHAKHLVLMNAEVDATLGPILHCRAQDAGVVVTGCDGDQPAVQMNLVRFVRGLGLTPRVLGNVKGLQDPYRTPTTQQGFAERWGQNVHMVTAFADGSKVNVEQALVANATGFGVARRGMLGLDHDGHVDQLATRYDLDMLRERGGIVDYVVGARPAPGVFCLAEHPDATQQHYLELFKLGTGPLYSFYAPYHLCHLEAPTTIARAVLFGDAAVAPIAEPVVEVVAIAKRQLRAGEVLDRYGGYTTYGQAENAGTVRREELLPLGLADGCRLRRDVPRDATISWDDVDAPSDRRSIDLYRAQCAELAAAEMSNGGETP